MSVRRNTLEPDAMPAIVNCLCPECGGVIELETNRLECLRCGGIAGAPQPLLVPW